MVSDDAKKFATEYTQAKAEVRQMEEQMLRATIRGANEEEMKSMQDSIERAKRVRDDYSRAMMDSLKK